MTFNGIASADLGIQVERPPAYVYPERDYEIQHVPGRNGDIVLDKGSYQNVTRSYALAIGSDEETFTDKANRIVEWLHSASGYARLEDSYEPEYFRMALYRETGTIANIFHKAGRVTVSFDCKPQRYLKAGEVPVTFTHSSRMTLLNPTSFQALPIVTVHGNSSGVLRIADYTVTIERINGSITINSEIQDAYSGIENRNPDITLPNGFPKLKPGENLLSFTGGITSIEVIPNWWTL